MAAVAETAAVAEMAAVAETAAVAGRMIAWGWIAVIVDFSSDLMHSHCRHGFLIVCRCYP
jgi:hypothetical protein